VICTDKTGTLTENRMQVRKLCLGGALNDLADEARLAALAARHPRFFEAIRLCHNLKATGPPGRQTFLGDPTEVALAQLSARLTPAALTSPRVDEMPFDSDRRRMSTLYRTPQGLVLYVKGALETLLPLCVEIETGSGTEVMTPEWQNRLLEAQEAMAGEGLRVLAVACRLVEEGYDHDRLEEQLTLTGLTELYDPPRPETAPAIATCRVAGIRVIMVTGDHPHTALAVAGRTAEVVPHPVATRA
jgi:magnesium-transporting ATPase (P-type)